MEQSYTLKPASCSRVTRHLPRHLLLARRQRADATVCHGLVQTNCLHSALSALVDKIGLRKKQEHNTEYISLEAVQPDNFEVRQELPQPPLKSLILQSTAAALHAGLRWTGIALRLAKIVVNDMRRSLKAKLQKPDPQKQASDLMRTAQAQLLLQAKRRMLEEQGRDAAFMQMLRNLDRCHMDHDEKWALFTKLSADKTEFSERWRHLYNLAMESKAAVETLLRPEASRHERNSFWKSAQTSAIIAEENALKQLVFAQVYQAQGN